MQAPPVTQQARNRRSAVTWISFAYFVSVLAQFLIGFLLLWFYFDTAGLAPGTGIRPMALTFWFVIIPIASILIGSLCALVGAILSLKQRRWRLAIIAGLAFAFSLVSWFISDWGFQYVVGLRKLFLED